MNKKFKEYLEISTLTFIITIVGYFGLHYLPSNLAPEQCAVISHRQLILDILGLLLLGFGLPIFMCIFLEVFSRLKILGPKWLNRKIPVRVEQIFIYITLLMVITLVVLVGMILISKYLCLS